jgi:hypothetical protein
MFGSGIKHPGSATLAQTSAPAYSVTEQHISVLWIRIRKNPKVFAGSGSETQRKMGSGSEKIVSDPQH